MEKTLKMLKFGFESSSQLTPRYATFFKTFRNELVKELIKHDADSIMISRGHFDAYGFFKIGGQWWYVSLPDVRGSEYKSYHQIMYRRCDGPKDYTGKANQWAQITNTGINFNFY